MKITLSGKYVTIISLLVFAMNALNYESRLLPITFLVLIILEGPRFPINRGTVYLFSFSITFYIISVMYHPEMITFYILPYLIGPTLGYAIGGKLLCVSSKEEAVNITKATIFSIVTGRFLHGALNFFVSDGYRTVIRNGIDIWTGTVLSATGQGALMTLAASLLFYGLFIMPFEHNKARKLAVITMSSISFANYLMSATRGGLYIALIVFVTESIIYLLFERKNIKQRRRIIILLTVLVVLVCFESTTGMLGIRDALNQTALLTRIRNEEDVGLSNEGRVMMLTDVLAKASDLPFGDGELSTAHNLWLDILKQTGWIPFVFLAIFTAYIIRRFWLLEKDLQQPLEIRYLVLAVALSACMNFFIEPVMKGMPYYFVGFCVIAGAVDGLIVETRSCLNKEKIVLK